jgi:PKD repeat protein
MRPYRRPTILSSTSVFKTLSGCFSLLLLLALPLASVAQCPVGGFTTGGAACSGQPLSLNNTSTGATRYQWDFCTGELAASNPTNTNVPITGATFNDPRNIHFANDNGTWYGFVCNFSAGNIIRLNFGSSVRSSAPTATVISNSNFTSINEMRLFKEGNNWYGLGTGYNTQLFRLSFGTSLANAPVVTAIPGLLSGLSIGLRIAREGNRILAFGINISGVLSILDFGTSITNTPVLVGTTPVANASVPTRLEIVKVCGVWSVFVVNLGTSDVQRLVYGSGLANAPLQTNFTGLAGATAWGAEIAADGGKFLLVISRDDGGIRVVDLGKNPATIAPVARNLTGLGYGNSFGNAIVNDNSQWSIFTFSQGGPTAIRRADFSQLCGANTPISIANVPTGISYVGSGKRYIQLQAQNDTGSVDLYLDSVTVSAAPTTGFNYSGGLCGSSATTFADTSTITSGSIASRSWNFGGLGTSTATNPSFTFPSAGSYAVKLVTTASSGCKDSLTKIVVIGNRPLAAFNSDAPKCANDSIQFTDASTVSGASIASRLWDFGDGTTLTQTNPKKAYATSGVKNVRLIVTSTLGCKDTLTQAVTVTSSPNAAFAFDNSCVGETIVFANQSSGSVTSYFWRFGDGTTSTQPSPTKAYTFPGTYQVRLVAFSSAGCKDSLSQTLQVGSKPNPLITAPSTACPFVPISFSGSSSTLAGDTIAVYGWRITSGSTSDTLTGKNIQYTFPAAGIYTIRLRTLGLTACDSVRTATISISTGPNTNFSAPSVCAGSSTTFTDLTVPPTGFVINSYSWNFAGLGNSNSVNPTFTFPAAGSYNVTLTTSATNGCSSSRTRTVRVFANPTASFSYSLAGTCTPLVATLNSSASASADTAIGTYLWDLGILGSSTQANPALNINSAGIYPLSLQVVTLAGCSSAVYRDTIRIAGPNIQVPASSCLGLPLSLGNNSVGITSQTWDFCSEDFSGNLTNANLTIGSTFEDSRGFVVVKDGNNWYGFSSNRNEGSLTRVDFGANIRNPMPTSIKILNAAFGTGVTGIRIVKEGNTWYGLLLRAFGSTILRVDFGTNLSNANPTVTDLGNPGGLLNGTFDLEVVREGGNNYVFITNFFANNLISVSFGNSLANAPTAVASLNMGAGGNASSVSAVRTCGVLHVFVGDFGTSKLNRVDYPNGVGGGSPTTTLLSPAGGSYQVLYSALHPARGNWYLLVKQSNGVVGILNLGPTASANSPTARQLNTFGFPTGQSVAVANDSSRVSIFTIRDGTTTTLSRVDVPNVCDASPSVSTAAVPTNIVYSSSGKRYIQFYGRAADGTDYIRLDSTTLRPKPTVNFGFRNTCAGNNTVFTDSSTITGTTITSKTWKFAGLGITTGSTVGFTFPGPGSYPVTLIITATGACTDSLTRTVVIGPPPGASINAPSTGCTRDSLNFADVSTVAAGSIVSRVWTFGDGTGSTLLNPRKAYTTTGSFTVKLVVTTALGCKDSTTRVVTISPKPLAAFLVDNSCVGESINFINQSSIVSGSISSYLWRLPAGQTSTATNLTRVFSAAGTYTVSLIAFSASGCTDSVTKQIVVGAKPVPVISSPITACQFNGVTFSGTGSTLAGDTIRQYVWYFGTDSLVGKTVVYSFPNSGLQTVRLRTVGGTACDSSTTTTITIQPGANASFSFQNRCLGSPVGFLDTSTPQAGITARTWYIDTLAVFTNNVAPTYFFAQQGTYQVILEVTSGGCVSRDTNYVRIFKEPTAQFTYPPITCAGDSLLLTNTTILGDTTIFIYDWDLGALGTSTLKNPRIQILNSGRYPIRLRATDYHLCSSLDFRDTVEVPGLINFVDPAQACVLNPLTVTDQSLGVQSFEWDFCSGDFRLPPLYGTVNAPVTSVEDGRGFRIVKDGSNFYGFLAISNSGQRKIVRYSFGTSLKNSNPTLSDLTSPLLVNPADLTFFQHGGNWYGFTLNVLSNRIIRMDFGSSPANTPTFVDLGNPSDSLSDVIGLTHIKEGPNYYLLVTGFTNQRVSVIRLGTSPANTPVFVRHVKLTRSGGVPQLFSIAGMALCGIVHVFVTDLSGFMLKMEFRNGMELPPFTAQMTVPTNLITTPGNLQIAAEQGTWNVLVLNSNATVAVLNVGRDATNLTPSGQRFTPAGTSTSYSLGFGLAQDSSRWYGFVSRNQAGSANIIRFDFRDSCSANIPFSTVREPAGVLYKTYGKYLIQCKGYFPDGSTRLSLDSITIDPAPDVRFGFVQPCAGSPTFFSDSSSTIAGINALYFWQFSTIGGSTLRNPTVTFPIPGNYTVKLEVTNSLGCIDSLTRIVTVSPRPDAGWSYSTGCAFDPVQFQDQSTIPTGSIIFRQWSFGDGATSLLTSPSHTYTRGGSYTVTEKVFSNVGCEDSLSSVIQVPGLEATVQNTCFGDSTRFTAIAFYPNTTVISYSWTLGDGATSTAPVFRHKYTSVGAYPVQLVVKTQSGCSDTVRLTVNVTVAPTVDFNTAGNVCEGNPTPFAPTLSVPTSQIATYRWQFGDTASGTADTSSLARPNHVFSSPGSYNVTLTINTLTACEVSITKTIVVAQKPIAGFSLPDTLCLGVLATLVDTSKAPGTTIITRRYDFGDGRFSTLPLPPVRYLTLGTYMFEQVVTNAVGCTDTARKTIVVVPQPTADFTASPRVGYAPLQVQFTNTSQNATQYLWQIEGIDTLSSFNASATFTKKGRYVVRLLASTSSTCVSIKTDTIIVDSLTRKGYDVQVVSLDTHLLGRNLQIRSILRNNGDTTIRQIRVTVRLNDENTLQSYWSGSLDPTQTVEYTLPYTLAFNRNLATQYLCLVADLPDGNSDLNIDDNELCKVLGSEPFFVRPWPNPTENLLNVEVVLPSAQRISVDFIDAMGSRVPPSLGFDGVAGMNRWLLNMSELSAGIYTLRFRYGETYRQVKVMKR